MFIMNYDERVAIKKVVDGKMDISLLGDTLLQRLYEYFEPEMDYGTKKARTGDPYTFIENRLERLLPKELPKGKYMMATVAHHLLGEISSDTPDICRVSEETETHYIGSWVTGLGFIYVHFPKETTRDLTQEEIEHYSKLEYGMFSSVHDTLSYPMGKLDIEGAK